MPNKSIVWVDEDKRMWSAERGGLNVFGYEVHCLRDANYAFDKISSLENHDNVKLFIFDVMLLAGKAGNAENVDIIKPSDKTGLILAEKLVVLDPSIGRKILFFTWSSSPGHIRTVQNVARKIGGHYLPKSKEYHSLGLAKKLREMELI